jgi:DNA helicase II / ATP-dependent DNA helicase PcrA
MRSSDVLRAQGEKLRKLRRSPYFGRFGFAREDDAGAHPFYVGVHDFRDDETGEAHVHDGDIFGESVYVF